MNAPIVAEVGDSKFVPSEALTDSVLQFSQVNSISRIQQQGVNLFYDVPIEN